MAINLIRADPKLMAGHVKNMPDFTTSKGVKIKKKHWGEIAKYLDKMNPVSPVAIDEKASQACKMNTDRKKDSDVKVLITEVLRAKPSAAKGKYIKSIALSPSMGPSVKLDAQLVVSALK